MSPRVLRPPPPDEAYEGVAPPGFHEEWAERDDRRAATGDERARKCRRPGCPRHAVMALRRSNGWWLYCDWHLYGSRITDDGRVVSRRYVPNETTP